jgi:thioredoxin reductase (NADPH)
MNPKINIIWNSTVTSVNGEAKVESVTLRNGVSGQETNFRTDGIFVYVGHLPNNEILRGKFVMDDQGYLATDRLRATSLPGIFAAGEIPDSHFRQVATSVGQGVCAALEAQKCLDQLEEADAERSAELGLERALA